MELQGLLLMLFFISMWPQLISKMTKNGICRWNTGQFRIRLEIYLERAAMKKKMKSPAAALRQNTSPMSLRSTTTCPSIEMRYENGNI